MWLSLQRFSCSLRRLCQGQPRIDDLAVDLVQVRKGPRLLGAVLNRNRLGDVTVAVEREWLRRAESRFFAEQTARESEEGQIAWRELLERLEAWREARQGEERLLDFIKSQHVRGPECSRRLNNTILRPRLSL